MEVPSLRSGHFICAKGTEVAIHRFAEVLELARCGDDRAHDQLYRQYAPAILGYARSHGAGDPENIVGEVFVCLLRGLPSFRGDEPAFRSWLFTMVHHRLVDERRRRARRPEDATDPVVLATRTSGRSVPAETDTVDPIASARLQAALERLTADQRRVVVLRIIADMPVDAVARAVGKASGAVKMLQRRGLDALARDLTYDAVA
jgi:RNA polymerase sigma-70 factor (ECF subfamily)